MKQLQTSRLKLGIGVELPALASHVGFKSGARGAHSSRTLMFEDLASVMTNTREGFARSAYIAAITDQNCLGKPTTATRRLSAQRLSELFGLDPGVPIFRVFRSLWDQDGCSRRLLAILLAVARDPLLAATAEAVIYLPAGGEYQRDAGRQALRAVTGERFNPSILDKVLRNTASSWTQSGHLVGRTFKKRCQVEPTVHSAVFALYLGRVTGFRGTDIFNSGWFGLLDCPPGRARELAVEAKKLSLIDLRISGDVVDLNLDRLDPQFKLDKQAGAA